MGQALYRTYRSKSLAEVMGQEHITQTLANAIKSGRISHAYLFTGPRGTGKTSTARILAYAINDLPYTGQPHLDIIEIDAASNRRIDDIRDLRDKVHIMPISARYKVYIIDEVHMLTGEAFNALLKTLEEPPEHVIFIMATTEVHKLPATIVSRAQRYSFRPAETSVVVKHLANIAKQEKITIDTPALTLIAEHGDGSFRDSISLLDQLANVSDGAINAELVEQTLGLAPRDSMQKLIDAMLAANQRDILAQMEQLALTGTTTTSLLAQLLRALQAVATKNPSLYQLIDNLLEVPRAYDPSLKLLTTLMKFTSNNLDKPRVASVAKHASANAAVAEPLLDIAVKTHPQAKPSVSSAVADEIASPVIKIDSSSIEPDSQQAKIEDHSDKKADNSEQTHSNEVGTAQELDDITEQQWSSIMAEVKQKSQPVFVVLRMASWDFDRAAQTLNLTFKFQLHRNKMEDTKSKDILATTIASQLGSAPIIKTALGQKAAAAKPSVDKVDPTANSVIEVMGGGELINPTGQTI
jgi:DNA polymerase-3 subunit gamma/tau